MHIDDLSQIHDVYDHVYLSPHLDDAALSCGGAIARYSTTETRVLVVTICTAMPPAEGPFSQVAQEFHSQWGLSPAEAVSVRLHEDNIAMERLGADNYWAGMSDALYRHPDAYPSRATLYATPAPDDRLLPELKAFLRTLRLRLAHATFYAPLGVGNHVDHQITYTAALDSVSDALAFYEDFPYVTKPDALERRLQALGSVFLTSIIDIDATLTRKIGAIESYASQIDALFGDRETMRQVIVEYAEALRPEAATYGERLWLRMMRP